MNLPSERLAAWTRRHQVELSLRADAAANAVDRAAGTLWGTLLNLLRSRPAPFDACQHSRRIFQDFGPTLAATGRQALFRIMAWTHKDTVKGMRAIPLPWLKAAALVAMNLTESRELREDAPGVIRIALHAAGLDFRSGSIRDLAKTLREPATSEAHAEEQREAFEALLFPAPSIEHAEELFKRPVAGISWEQRLEGATRYASPMQLADVVTRGFAQGKLPSEIARDLRGSLDLMRSSARRIARTASMQLAHSIQREADAGLLEAGMLVGHQIHATMDENTRPKHAARNGTVYYIDPKRGQAGLDQMPDPPLEADGSIAWNCRCRLSPVLSAPDYLKTPKALATLKTASGKLIPDAVSYSEWFDRADVVRRQRAVGVRRYAAVKGEYSDKPPWEAFIDPDTGDLMPLDVLRAESIEERAERAGEVRRLVADRAAKLREIGMLGFEMG